MLDLVSQLDRRMGNLQHQESDGLMYPGRCWPNSFFLKINVPRDRLSLEAFTEAGGARSPACGLSMSMCLATGPCPSPLLAQFFGFSLFFNPSPSFFFGSNVWCSVSLVPIAYHRSWCWAFPTSLLRNTIQLVRVAMWGHAIN
jgi:hypothetical protein